MSEKKDDRVDLPAGWLDTTIVRVSTTVDKVQPKRDFDKPFKYVDVSSIDSGVFKIVDPRFVEPQSAPSRARQKIREGDVLFSTVRVYLKNIGYVTKQFDDQVASTAFCVLRPDRAIDSQYLFRFVTSDNFINDLLPLQRGNSPPAVLEDDIRAQSILLPPLNEQRRIADKIDELFSDIDEGETCLRRVEGLVKRYRQSVLKAAVTGELTRGWREKNAGKGESGADLLERILAARREAWEAAELAKMKAKGQEPKNDKWRGKYKEPEPPDTSELPDLPEGWVWASLPQLGELGRGKSKHRPRNDPKLYGGEFPFLQTGTVRQSGGRIRTYDATYNETGLAQSRLWPKGTLCITIAANIANTGILEIDACFPDSIVGLIASAGVQVELVEIFIRTVRDELDRYAPATAQKNINLETLYEVAVPLPSSQEQREIVDRAEALLTEIDAVEATLQHHEVRAASLRQAILKAAFGGKLVPQNHSDEPASALLERIAAERAANATTTTKRRTARGKKRRAQIQGTHP